MFVLIFKRYNLAPYCLDDFDNAYSNNLKDDVLLKEIDGGKNGIPKELKEILKSIFKLNINKYFENEMKVRKISENDKKDEIRILLEENDFSDFQNSYENLKNLILKKKIFF